MFVLNGSCCIVQISLELSILLPQLPFWDYIYVLPCLAQIICELIPFLFL